MEQITVVKVKETDKDFYELCFKLENFQCSLIPTLAEKGYSLTDDFENIEAFVMYDNKKPIGSIGLKPITKETCEIVRVYVCDEYRGKGYAKLLFSKIEELARKRGYTNAEMVTWAASTSALSLYKKLGFCCSEEKESEWFKGLNYFELNKEL